MKLKHCEKHAQGRSTENNNKQPTRTEVERRRRTKDEDEARHTTDLRHVRCWNETRPQRTCCASLEQLKQLPLLSLCVCMLVCADVCLCVLVCACVCVLVLVSVRQFVCFVKVELG